MISMLVPFNVESAPGSRRQVEIRPLPSDPHVVLINNGKLQADDVLRSLGQALVDRGTAGSYAIFNKTTTVPLSQAERAAVTEGADLVISGVGDCGGCSSMVTIDALSFVELGLPTFVVATHPFSYLVDTTDRQIGLAGLGRLFLDHPIWAHDPQWYEANGTRLAAELANALAGAGGEQETPAGEATRPQAQATTGQNQSTIPTAHTAPVDTTPFAELQEILAADGYQLEVDRVDETFVFRVLAGPDSCSDCLVPKSVFADIARRAAQRAGLDISQETCTVIYPAEAAV